MLLATGSAQLGRRAPRALSVHTGPAPSLTTGPGQRTPGMQFPRRATGGPDGHDPLPRPSSFRHGVRSAVSAKRGLFGSPHFSPPCHLPRSCAGGGPGSPSRSCRLSDPGQAGDLRLCAPFPHLEEVRRALGDGDGLTRGTDVAGTGRMWPPRGAQQAALPGATRAWDVRDAGTAPRGDGLPARALPH